MYVLLTRTHPNWFLDVIYKEECFGAGEMVQ